MKLRKSSSLDEGDYQLNLPLFEGYDAVQTVIRIST